MEFPNGMDFDKEKLQNLKGTLESREKLLEALQVLETEKNRFEKLYINLVQRNTETAKIYLASNTWEEKYKELEEKYHIVQQQKIEQERRFEELKIIQECDFQLRECELREEISKLTKNFTTQINKTEQHYKDILNQRNDEVKTFARTNKQLQCELQILKTLSSQNEIDQHKSDEVKYYQEQLKSAEALISKLQGELNRQKDNNNPIVRSLSIDTPQVLNDQTGNYRAFPIKERKVKNFTVNSIMQSQQLQVLQASSQANYDPLGKSNNLNNSQVYECSQAPKTIATKVGEQCEQESSLGAYHMNIMDASTSANESYDTIVYPKSKIIHFGNRHPLEINEGTRRRGLPFGYYRKVRPDSAKKRKLLSETLLNLQLEDTDTTDNE